ncbi:putative dual specificity protein phosphatase [Trypanosoma grayi]|uniref:putative dual specificity protein phosphatase n=1 Tax=Trypanosoma grayi TaxID=71804 RepID=UPI0004F4265A|nr:putative dual specificity protein phosphatase [Trypanosoma grayi]KEG12085.1 putative dual specificity protein phosphatase [Trypanosoma grayi]
MQELIAVRVKDGIFVGNVTAAQDREFISMNKVTHVINCAGGELPDLFMDDGVKYLTFPWKDTPGAVCTAVMFDSADENIKRAVKFIDEAIEAGDCVLVHSRYGLSRSPALIAAYFIVKYGWKLDSAISFLEMAHKDMSIKPHFLRQLRMFAKRNSVEHDVFDLDVDDSQFGLDNDQWMLRNTLLNGLISDMQRQNELYKFCTGKLEVGQPVKPSDSRAGTHGKKSRRIVFVDTKQGTHVDSVTGSPVVMVQPKQQQLDSSNHFVGFQGSVALRARRRSGSIMSRSITPCGRRAESDPHTNPRGRQELSLRSDGKTGRSASIPDGATSSQAARTASGHSTLDGGSHAGAEYRHVAPPNTVHAPLRSPFAALTSSHKYRKGSPLPAPTHDKKPSAFIQRPASASMVETRPARTRVAASTGSSFLSRNSLVRSGSPTAPGNAPTTPIGSSSTSRVSSYKNIAPHRTQLSTGPLPAWNWGKSGMSPSVVQRTSLRSSPQGSRPSSPAGRSSSATKQVASPSSASLELHLSRGVNGTSSSTIGGSNGVLRRQPPTVISSGRRS